MSGCGARIRPFPNDTELQCELPNHGDPHRTHRAVLRDYAYPGSETTLQWQENDRRCFYGEWAPCPDPGCVLPNLHRGGHAL